MQPASDTIVAAAGKSYGTCIPSLISSTSGRMTAGKLFKSKSGTGGSSGCNSFGSAQGLSAKKSEPSGCGLCAMPPPSPVEPIPSDVVSRRCPKGLPSAAPCVEPTQKIPGGSEIVREEERGVGPFKFLVTFPLFFAKYGHLLAEPGAELHFRNVGCLDTRRWESDALDVRKLANVATEMTSVAVVAPVLGERHRQSAVTFTARAVGAAPADPITGGHQNVTDVDGRMNLWQLGHCTSNSKTGPR